MNLIDQRLSGQMTIFWKSFLSNKLSVKQPSGRMIIYTLKTPVFEIASMLKYIRVEMFVLHNGEFCIENFS
jgi:hypothetical protein